MKSFEGYYQLPYKLAFIAFDEQDNTFYATQLKDQKKDISSSVKMIRILNPKTKDTL